MTIPNHQILVCINERPASSPKGSCKARGSLEVYQAIRQAIEALGLKGQIAVNTTSCLKCCPFGPTVVVWPGGLYYGGISPQRARTLVEAIRGGLVIEQWLIPEDEVGRY